ncbi:hypothetical protein [Rhodococcus wratislaviensis]|uniref:hypothetical protein n=1 Tax=Rhodococcus wratislaviensis TaxID=44752 RepID=UPI0004B21DD9|nr:hypothetical protein [Rhodococcus wratislaviensis]
MVAKNSTPGGCTYRPTFASSMAKVTTMRASGCRKSNNVLDVRNPDSTAEQVAVDRDTWDRISIGDSYPR